MLEACYQAAMWMVRTGENFAHPLVMMREAKQVKFGDFLAPGETLEITAELVKEEGELVTVKVSAKKGERTTVSARLILEKQKTHYDPRLEADADISSLAEYQFKSLFPDWHAKLYPSEGPAISA